MHAAIKYQNESYINSFVNDLLIWFLGVFLTEKKPVIPVMLPCFRQYKQLMKKKKSVLWALYATISYKSLMVVPKSVWEENKD